MPAWIERVTIFAAVAPTQIHGITLMILSDFCKVYLAQSERTFSAVRLLP